MNKKLIVVSIVILMLVIGLSGCIESDEDKFLGVWTYEYAGGPGYMEFNSNGSNKVWQNIDDTTPYISTYEILDNNIVKITSTTELESPGVYEWSTWGYAFSNDGKTLTLTMVGGTEDLVPGLQYILMYYGNPGTFK